MWFSIYKYVIAGPVLYALGGRPRYRGAGNVPADGAVLLVSNHLSPIDPFYLSLGLRRRVYFAGKSENFSDGGGARQALRRWFYTTMGQISVNRKDGSVDTNGLGEAVDRLSRGDMVGFFPEGTRSPDGNLHRGRTGAAVVALRTGCRIVPAAVSGTEKVNSARHAGFRAGKVRVVFGEPFTFPEYQGYADDEDVVREVTDQIMTRIQALSEQPYVDTFSPVK